MSHVSPGSRVGGLGSQTRSAGVSTNTAVGSRAGTTSFFNRHTQSNSNQSRVVFGGTNSRGFRQNHAVSGLGGFGINGGGGFGGGGFGSGFGGFGPFGGLGNYYPGAVFGYDLTYLRSRAISAVGGFGTASTGTPQDATTDPSGGSAVPASTSETGNSGDNVTNGEAAFRAGDYRLAIDEWGKALAGGSQDPLLQMMLGQAYFAAGSYRDAAVATQAAMHALRSDD
jgi:hypothetical protein